MRSLVAFALLALAVASAHHTPEHSLRGPRYVQGKLYHYDVEYNITSGVLGMRSQVSKAAYKAEISIYAKTADDYLLKVDKVWTSGSLKAVDSKYSDIPMEVNPELQDRLSVPIKFRLEKGVVTSYTLSSRESLESKKFKKSILRSLEMHVPEEELQKMESNTELRIPVTYNNTKGVHYMITVSPYAEFPLDDEVYNITRSDDFEAERYPAFKVHHNFQQQGCPEVCRKDWKSNEYGAGCPVGYEPHHSPIKMSFNHEHHLKLEDRIMTPEIIRTTEAHIAQVYDQDMEVLVLFQMRRKKGPTGSIVEPSGQQTFTDLKDLEAEINEKEIEDLCQYKTSEDSIKSIKGLFASIAEIIVHKELGSEEAALIGNKVLLLKGALTRLTVQDLKMVQKLVQVPANIPNASPEEKVKRQVWLDVLPLIGTEESVTFIVHYIKEGLADDELLIWEAKEILEMLPQNVHRPTERTISELYSLLSDEVVKDKIKTSHLLHSATYLSLARVIGSMCGNATIVRNRIIPRSAWFSYKQAQEVFDGPSHGPPECSVEKVSEIVKEVTEELEKATKKEEIAVYLETLAHIGVSEVLPVLSRYVYGTAEVIQKYSLSYIDFVKSLSLYALHNLASKHPEEVLHLVLPVYFNGTENPKVRNAAFGVLIRCHPSLEILQHVAIKSWSETSQEVGSYVTSTLETFGNSSLPCMQLTSHRIKQVLPQVRRFNIGVHHAKNLLWSYFDENTEFGLEGRLEYTPSNSSFIPSALYKSLSYSTESMRDVLMQMAINIDGVTFEKVWKMLENKFHVQPMVPFTRAKESEIFGDAPIKVRLPEELRLTLYKRFFYCSSYYYLDDNNLKTMMDELFKYLMTYLRKDSSTLDGHLVKTFVPSTFHTVAVARTLPYPVEFKMSQPLVLALKVKSLDRFPKPNNFKMYFRPRVYYTRLYTNQIKNLGDCKEVGVYHEQRIAAAFPFELEYRGINYPNCTLKYKIPELNKKILTYFSESGTYAGKKLLESLPMTTDRAPILTRPTPFEYEKEINLIGIPPIHVQIHTEDIDWKVEKMPRSPQEVIEILLRRIGNAGWRQKSLNVTLYQDSKRWPDDTEVTFKVDYSREHFARKLTDSMASTSDYEDTLKVNSEWVAETESTWDSDSETSTLSSLWNDTPKEDEDWVDNLKPYDLRQIIDLDVYIRQAELADQAMYVVPHMAHTWNIKIETMPLNTSASAFVRYNHTYSKTLHSLHMDASVKSKRGSKPYMVTLDHIMAFHGKPNLFDYYKNPEQQAAVFITAVDLPTEKRKCGWKYAKSLFKGLFSYESLEKLLNRELSTSVDSKYFLPETHETCLKHKSLGKPASPECLRAVKENAVFNKLYLSLLWKEGVPATLTTIARRLDIYAKHYLFHHLNITEEENPTNKVILRLNHIDKFVDEPVFDVHIRKPDETLDYKRIPAQGLQPLNSVFSTLETETMKATNNTYPATCVVMKDYVRTYDMKTYRFTTEQCNYVLSTHCTRNKYFAITGKGLSSGTKEITIYVADKSVVLTPPSRKGYHVTFNGKDVVVYNAIVLDSKHEIYAYPELTSAGSLLRVIARSAGINVLYDGTNVKVKVDPKYKGELCGLCSEFDGETLREYRGLDQCLYTHPVDFANSAITKREGRCEKNIRYGERACYGEDLTTYKTGEHDSHEPTLTRNLVETRGNEYCFSTLPVPVCEDNALPLETERTSVSFHCLPKNDLTAKKLITDTKFRVLEELKGKSVDFEETLDVATMC